MFRHEKYKLNGALPQFQPKNSHIYMKDEQCAEPDRSKFFDFYFLRYGRSKFLESSENKNVLPKDAQFLFFIFF